MKITPLDIQGHEFKRKFRGLDPEEVRAFLAMVSEEYENLVVANTRLNDEIAELRERLGDLKERERILKDTLYTAQKLADDMKSEAHKERDLLLKEGELKAEYMIDHARLRVQELEGEILDLKSERDAFEAKIRHVIDQHIKLLDLRKEDEDVSSRLRFIKRRQTKGPSA